MSVVRMELNKVPGTFLTVQRGVDSFFSCFECDLSRWQAALMARFDSGVEL